VEKYSKNPEEYPMETAKGLQPLIEVALKISRLEALTGRKEPTVVSVTRCRAMLYMRSD
jgi:phosphoglucomutase